MRSARKRNLRKAGRKKRKTANISSNSKLHRDRSPDITDFFRTINSSEFFADVDNFDLFKADSLDSRTPVKISSPSKLLTSHNLPSPIFFNSLSPEPSDSFYNGLCSNVDKEILNLKHSVSQILSCEKLHPCNREDVSEKLNKQIFTLPSTKCLELETSLNEIKRNEQSRFGGLRENATLHKQLSSLRIRFSQQSIECEEKEGEFQKKLDKKVCKVEQLNKDLHKVNERVKSLQKERDVKSEELKQLNKDRHEIESQVKSSQEKQSEKLIQLQSKNKRLQKGASECSSVKVDNERLLKANKSLKKSCAELEEGLAILGNQMNSLNSNFEKTKYKLEILRKEKHQLEVQREMKNDSVEWVQIEKLKIENETLLRQKENLRGMYTKLDREHEELKFQVEILRTEKADYHLERLSEKLKDKVRVLEMNQEKLRLKSKSLESVNEELREENANLQLASGTLSGTEKSFFGTIG